MSPKLNWPILLLLLTLISGCKLESQFDPWFQPGSLSTDSIPPTLGTPLSFSDVTGNSLKVTWGLASDNVTEPSNLRYKLVKARSLSAVDTVAKVDSISGENLVIDWTPNLNFQTVTGLSEGTTYYFAVVVKDIAKNKALYAPVGQTTLDVTPPSPSYFLASTGVAGTSFTLNWTPATDNVSSSSNLQYKVVMASTGAAIDPVVKADQISGPNLIRDWTVNLISQNVTGLTEGTNYYFAVVVKDESGNKSLYSPENQTPDGTAPGTGSFLATTGVSSTSFTLNWTTGFDNVTPVENLQYLVCSGPGLTTIFSVEGCLSATIEQGWTPNLSSLLISGKSFATVYHFNVLVRDSAGNIRAYEGKTQGTAGVFMSKWNTGNLGVSNGSQIKLPLESGGTYNFTVDWGDGSLDTITAWDSPSTTHTYSDSGGWVIGISGVIEGFRFNNEGDRQKLIEIQQWGPLRFGNSSGYFYGANNLQITASDIPDLTGTTDLSLAFAECYSMTTVPNLANWDVSSVTNLRGMFRNAINYDSNAMANWDISNVINMEDMLRGTTLSTANYEALLLSWRNLTVQPDVVLDVGNAVYASQEAIWAVSILTDSPNNWKIHDGLSTEAVTVHLFCDQADLQSTWRYFGAVSEGQSVTNRNGKFAFYSGSSPNSILLSRTDTNGNDWSLQFETCIGMGGTASIEMTGPSGTVSDSGGEIGITSDNSIYIRTPNIQAGDVPFKPE